MKPNVPTYIGKDAVPHLLDYCKTLPAHPYTIISDANTYAALGQQVHTALQGAGYAITNIVLKGDEIIADEKYLMQTMIKTPPGDMIFVGVGTGTLTDITRYVSFRTRNPFIAVPTAPSVDGFVSSGAPLVVGGIKETFKSQGPLAVFADLPTSVAAPQPLKAAGFGDIVGKYTSLADWKLGSILWNEPFSTSIEQHFRELLDNCVNAVDDIARNTEQGVCTLMQALIDSGLYMLEWGDSRPASGSEHHCSHYWELTLLRTNRKAILHGAKVGYAATLMAKLYETIRGWSRDKVASLLQQSNLPGYDAGAAEIKQAYPLGFEDVIQTQKPFLNLTEAQFNDLKARIVDNWDQIQAIASTVPPSTKIAEILQRAGAPTSWQALGLQEQDVIPAVIYGHNLRNRFTVIKLLRTCGVNPASLL